MASAYDRLPLNALRVFEAVASRLSFAEAAEALHVTPAAVSMQIRTLEEYLQVPLFRRSGRKVELTAEGQHLLPGICRGLDELESALSQLRRDRAGGQINITMLASFLQKWLLPRMPQLRLQHADVDLRIHTGREQVDFSRSDFHAAVRLGGGTYRGLHSEKIMDEWLVAVGSPALIAKHGPLRGNNLAEELPLLHGTDEPWVHWLEVGGAALKPVRGSVLDDSVSVLLAAEQGLGFALVRWSLAAGDLQAGRLELASPIALPYRWSYHFVCPQPYLMLPKVAKFREWLQSACRAFPMPQDYVKEHPVRGPGTKPAAVAATTVAPAKIKPPEKKPVQRSARRRTGRKA